MKFHKYQAKKLLSEYGIPIPWGRVAKTAEEAEEISKRIKASPLRAQARKETL